MSEWKQKLEPFGRLYLGMRKGIEGYLHPMSDEQLRRLCEDCEKPTLRNCGWTVYRVRGVVQEIALEILQDRKMEREATHE